MRIAVETTQWAMCDECGVLIKDGTGILIEGSLYPITNHGTKQVSLESVSCLQGGSSAYHTKCLVSRIQKLTDNRKVSFKHEEA